MGSMEWIAMATMLIDHIGVIFFPDEEWLRMIGRLAFPIYCWGIVQGFRRTRSIEKYRLRLIFIAFISQIPYFLAFKLLQLNVVFTLLLGLWTLDVIVRKPVGKEGYLLFILGLSIVLPLEYGFYGIILILFFYYLRGSRLVGAHFILNLLFWGMFGWDTQMLSILATLGIAYIRPQLIQKSLQIPRSLYRSFYPVHLFVLSIIQWMVK